MKLRHVALALGAFLVALLALPLDAVSLQAAVDGVAMEVAGPSLLLFGAVAGLKEIRISTPLGYGDRALGRGDVVKVGSGKDAVDARTAESWVRAGLAISTVPQEGPDLTPAGTRVVVHERGGQELFQSASTVGEGPAEPNPTDSDPDEDAEAGATRTAAGAVIAENADPDVVADAKPAKRKK